MTSVMLPDGSVKKFDQRVSVSDVAKSIGSRLAKDAMWGEINLQPVKLDYQIPVTAEPVSLKIITKTSPVALETMRHSCAHVMARAVMRLKKGTQLAFGPCTEQGFYYDFECESPLTEDDFPAIEAEMRKIIELDEPFERVEKSKPDAVQICKDLKQHFKVEHIETGLQDQELSFYQQGEFIDLCRGPHIPSPKTIGAFKLLSIAGAYWKGDQNNPQLQRLYATAFFTQEELDAHLQQAEEAKKRDHRVLGKRLGLFHIDDMVGQGLVLWAPKGAFVRQKLQDFILAHLKRQGYDQVFTPHIGRLELYKTSGHFPYYQDSQYPPLVDREFLTKLSDEGCSCGQLANLMGDGAIDGYLLRPMNCPHHIKIFASQPRSYRDLPIRLSEFGTVYRWEQSGEIGGMTRVRGFTQDDAHLFVTQDQLDAELQGCLELVKIVFEAMGMNEYSVRVGLRDPDSSKYVGDPKNWDLAEQACRKAAQSLGKPFREEAGEAAFYGPKIDFVVKDCIGRSWQTGTVQVDYNLPIRFNLEYIGADNHVHRPIMIHRAPFGSMERFIGLLIEHFAGAFPMWLAPEQIRIATVSDKSEEYGRHVEKQLKAVGLRVHGDYRSEKLGAKIRDGQLEKIPYTLVVGPKDAEAGTVSVRCLHRGDLGALPVAAAIAQFTDEVERMVLHQ
jgi:threonyl-tRNA synthetase